MIMAKSKPAAGGSNRRRPLSPEALANIAAANRRRTGQTHSPEALAKIGAASRGRTHTPKTRRKMSAAHKGHEVTAETRAKIAATKKGQTRGPLSPKLRAKLSALRKGRPGRTPSEETKAKLAAANRGRTPSDETRRKMSAARKGRPLSPEHLAKVVAANKRRAGQTKSAETRAKIAATKRGGRFVSRDRLDRDPSLKAILDQDRAGRPESATSPGRSVFIGGQKVIVFSAEQARVIELLDRKPRRRYSLAEIGKLAGVKQPRKVLTKLLKYPRIGARIATELGDYGSKFYRVVEFRT
jgi:hypothetical protein